MRRAAEATPVRSFHRLAHLMTIPSDRTLRLPRLPECLARARTRGGELEASIVPWGPGGCLNAAREQVAAMLSRTRWFGSTRTLLPSQVVSPMSGQWIREQSYSAAHRGDDF